MKVHVHAHVVNPKERGGRGKGVIVFVNLINYAGSQTFTAILCSIHVT